MRYKWYQHWLNMSHMLRSELLLLFETESIVKLQIHEIDLYTGFWRVMVLVELWEKIETPASGPSLMAEQSRGQDWSV